MSKVMVVDIRSVSAVTAGAKIPKLEYNTFHSQCSVHHAHRLNCEDILHVDALDGMLQQLTQNALDQVRRGTWVQG